MFHWLICDEHLMFFVLSETLCHGRNIKRKSCYKVPDREEQQMNNTCTYTVFGREINWINKKKTRRHISNFEDYLLAYLYRAPNYSDEQLSVEMKKFLCRCIKEYDYASKLTADTVKTQKIQSFLKKHNIDYCFFESKYVGLGVGSPFRLSDYYNTPEVLLLCDYLYARMKSEIRYNNINFLPYFFCCRSDCFINGISLYILKRFLSQLYMYTIKEEQGENDIAVLACYIFLWHRLKTRMDKNATYNKYEKKAQEATQRLIKRQKMNGSWPDKKGKYGSVLHTCLSIHALSMDPAYVGGTTLKNAQTWLKSRWEKDNNVVGKNPAFDCLCIDSLALCERENDSQLALYELILKNTVEIPNDSDLHPKAYNTVFSTKSQNEDNAALGDKMAHDKEHETNNHKEISTNESDVKYRKEKTNMISTKNESEKEKNIKENEPKDNKNSIFISHRSSDKELADLLLDFFIATGIPREAVFCSSLPGNDVKENISAEVKQAIQSSRINIVILSQEYYESAYCLNEAGVIWFLDHAVAIPIALPEIKPEKMYGFLNSEYKIRHFDETNDIAYINDTIRELLKIPQLKATVFSKESGKLIKKYTDYINTRREKPKNPKAKSMNCLGVTVPKYNEKENNYVDTFGIQYEDMAYNFEVVLYNNSDKTISVYEKYLVFYQNKQEIGKKEVLDEEGNPILLLQPGYGQKISAKGIFSKEHIPDRVVFKCFANDNLITVNVKGNTL